VRFIVLAINTWPMWVGVINGPSSEPFLLGLIAWALLNPTRPT
jgi:hypothetical protein